MTRRLFVINPNAGKGRALRYWKLAEAELHKRQIVYDCFMTNAPGDAVGHLKNLAGFYDQVIAVGGDGTIHEVVNGIVQTGAKLGIIPAGTGNDFAQYLNLNGHFDPVRSVERILQNQSVPVDLVCMQEKVFINVAGMGFDAAVAADVNRSTFLKKMGSLGYVASVMRQLPGYRPGAAMIEIDGSKHHFEDAWLIAVGNGGVYGGGMKILPQADCRDGLLEVCVVSGISKLELLRVFPKVFSGSHVRHPAVKMFRGSEVRVISKANLRIHADGEIVTRVRDTEPEEFQTDEKFKILPKAIDLLV
ncbi:diacylglycerol/lipid kinase family protein [Effusibacillus lacus]|uniref:DAGKc domain-containing protein n=1 Tax=Effusibacillus lacus TaxID=1348429 RepID=A0A292YHG2_9BACL|nr:diacylglycerol kinase family protein [Effusibacillus lacus]TCS75183.1 YegS/Rv2252/BmrU family lipid kinase [Effusibacillus lacus]GAX89128.1 hypothetical protein EFBL_0746 [Effusibacillus lacus]